MTFYLEKTNKEIGTTLVNVPESILTKEELELADDFVFNYTEVRYYNLHNRKTLSLYLEEVITL